jgi:hypothetical protein
MSSFVIICQQPEDFAMFQNLPVRYKEEQRLGKLLCLRVSDIKEEPSCS